ncbi:hypothetical protein [Streptomyces sp. NPDC058683]
MDPVRPDATDTAEAEPAARDRGVRRAVAAREKRTRAVGSA